MQPISVPSSVPIIEKSLESLAGIHNGQELVRSPKLPPLTPDAITRFSYCQSHFGEDIRLPSPSNDREDSIVASMKVCEKCKDALLKTFDHCLVKAGGDLNPLQSVRYIDEEADATPKTEQPYFDIIADPTKRPYVDENQQKVERERFILHQSKKAQSKLEKSLPIALNHSSKPIGFSGAIYKRMLDAKDHEINVLRGQLFDAKQRNETESANVRRLRIALNRSVNYYTFAEEWQQNESARLQHDVKYLKGEISSLMACLINSEEQKRLVNDIDVAQK